MLFLGDASIEPIWQMFRHFLRKPLSDSARGPLGITSGEIAMSFITWPSAESAFQLVQDTVRTPARTPCTISSRAPLSPNFPPYPQRQPSRVVWIQYVGNPTGASCTNASRYQPPQCLLALCMGPFTRSGTSSRCVFARALHGARM